MVQFSYFKTIAARNRKYGTFLPVFTAFRYYYVCLLFRTLVWDKNGTTYRGFADIAAALEKLVLLI